MKEKVICITGCLGFIGSHFTEKCLKNGWWVYGVDKCTYAANLDLLDEFKSHPKFKFIEEDICNLKYIPDCNYLVNFAAESHVENSIVDSDKFIKTNIDGTKNLLQLIRLKSSNTYHKPVFIQISTDEVYGDICTGYHTEKDLLIPSNPYSASKAAADMLVLAWARTYDIKYIIMRPTNNYGIRQYPEKLIPIAVRNLKRGNKIKIHNQGVPTRNWLHVEDTADAILTVIDNSVENEIYNVSGNFEESILQTVIKIIKEFHNTEQWNDYILFGHDRAGQDVRYALCDQKLRALGWENKKSFNNELKTIVSYYKNNFRW